MGKKKFSNPLPYNQNRHYTYNDGFIKYGLIKIIKNTKKEKIAEEFEIIGKRPFANVNIRDSDNQIADSLGYTIDQKIRIPISVLPQNIKIKINSSDTIYEVKKRDSSDGKNIYLYLQMATAKKVEETTYGRWKNN